MSEHNIVFRPDGIRILVWCKSCRSVTGPGENLLLCESYDRAGGIPADEVLLIMKQHMETPPTHCSRTKFPDGTLCGEFGFHGIGCPERDYVAR